MSGGKPFRAADAPGYPAVRTLPVAGRGADGGSRAALWHLAEEVPVEIGFNGRPWVVMLASPCDLEDLARGLSFTEGVVGRPEKIGRFDIRHYPEGITVDVNVAAGELTDRVRRFRALDGYTGCGLCGVETLADTARPFSPRPGTMIPDDGAVARAFWELKNRQPLNAATRSVHAAAWCAAGGEVLLVREDVGRHNALDKLIGALLREAADPAGGFFVMTSRCSMELVQKAAAFGAPLLATISAPTYRALELAAAAGLAVRCLESDDMVMSFNLEPDGGKG